jgi:hypothetical protein
MTEFSSIFEDSQTGLSDVANALLELTAYVQWRVVELRKKTVSIQFKEIQKQAVVKDCEQNPQYSQLFFSNMRLYLYPEGT